MNLLLILSALLSALTGLTGGARAPEMATQVARGTAIAGAAAVRRVAAPARPAQAPEPLAASARAAVVLSAPRVALPPIFAQRRRE